MEDADVNGSVSGLRSRRGYQSPGPDPTRQRRYDACTLPAMHVVCWLDCPWGIVLQKGLEGFDDDDKINVDLVFLACLSLLFVVHEQ